MWPFTGDITSQYKKAGFLQSYRVGEDWSSYAEGWRILGTYIDCSPLDYGYGGEDNQDNNDDNNNNDYSTCRRWWLWAAYVDEYHEGNGFKEYQYYDTNLYEWVEVCDLHSTKQRCVKMDCHEPNTNFTLIGVFKIAQEDGDFFDQLFKHEGYCLWDNDQYDFMQEAKDSWPQACTRAGENQYDQHGNPLYYDMKPLEFGRVDVGLYSDPYCLNSYDDEDKLGAMTQAADANNEISDLNANLAIWEHAMEMFRVCQPCVSYNLPNVTEAYNSKNRHWWNRNLNDGENGDVDYTDPFYCYDAAGYQNVNQCNKFASQTNMMKASFEDMQLATAQGTILHIDIGNFRFGKSAEDAAIEQGEIRHAWLLLGLSLLIFVFALFYYVDMLYRASRREARYLNAKLLDSPKKRSGRRKGSGSSPDKSSHRKDRRTIVTFDDVEHGYDGTSNGWFARPLGLLRPSSRAQSPNNQTAYREGVLKKTSESPNRGRPVSPRPRSPQQGRGQRSGKQPVKSSSASPSRRARAQPHSHKKKDEVSPSPSRQISPSAHSRKKSSSAHVRKTTKRSSSAHARTTTKKSASAHARTTRPSSPLMGSPPQYY